MVPNVGVFIRKSKTWWKSSLGSGLLQICPVHPLLASGLNYFRNGDVSLRGVALLQKRGSTVVCAAFMTRWNYASGICWQGPRVCGQGVSAAHGCSPAKEDKLPTCLSTWSHKVARRLSSLRTLAPLSVIWRKRASDKRQIFQNAKALAQTKHTIVLFLCSFVAWLLRFKNEVGAL